MATASALSAPALPVRNKGLLTIALMLAMMMQILDTTVANVALPHMQASLGATVETVTWVLTSYIIASAVAMPITGWLSDRIGSRQLMLGSVAFFIAASMLCGIAQNLQEMVLFRIAQGIAAAFIGPMTQSAMLDINPREKHGQAMSIWSAGAVLGPILGPVIGGWLTEYYSWRWVFYVNLPIGIVTLTLLYALLPGRPQRRRSFDLFGFSAIAIGLAALQLMLDRGQQLDWFDSWEIVITFGLAICGFWVFIVHMATGRNTIVSPSLFANRNFVGALLLVFLSGMLVFATMALLPPLLQGILGYPVLSAGMMLAPRGMGVIVAMLIAGRILSYVDARLVLGTGLVIAAWSLHMMTQWSIEMNWWPVVASGLVQGFGIGLIFVSLNLIAFATLPSEMRTEAAAMLNLFRSVGASLGISIGAFNLARNLQTSHSDLVQHITPHSLPLIPLETMGHYERFGEAALAAIDAEINRQALMIAYLDDFWLMMVATVVTVPGVLLLARSSQKPAAAPQPAE